MNLRHPKSAQNAQTDDQTGLEPPNSQATAPPATPGNTQRRASPGPTKPQATTPPYRHRQRGQTRTKMQVTKHRNTKPQVTASQTQPWGVTPRPATTGDAHANYHFSPRQLLAQGPRAPQRFRGACERCHVLSAFVPPGWRGFYFLATQYGHFWAPVRRFMALAPWWAGAIFLCGVWCRVGGAFRRRLSFPSNSEVFVCPLVGGALWRRLWAGAIPICAGCGLLCLYGYELGAARGPWGYGA